MVPVQRDNVYIPLYYVSAVMIFGPFI
jgi:hypothetical protein